MTIRKLIYLLIFIPSLCWADPFLYTDSYPTSGTQPTHCYLYVDGSGTPIKSLVGVKGNGDVYCRVDLSGVTVGTHTLQLSAAIESGGVLQSESTKTSLKTLLKENCGDPVICIFKYQYGETILWYK